MLTWDLVQQVMVCRKKCFTKSSCSHFCHFLLDTLNHYCLNPNYFETIILHHTYFFLHFIIPIYDLWKIVKATDGMVRSVNLDQTGI